MIDQKKAKKNFDIYLKDGLLKKEKNKTAKAMYIKNAELSLDLADEIIKSDTKPYLWVVVVSYYSMFYIANALLLELGYKTGTKVVHKVTNDALIVLIKNRIKNNLLEEYEDTKEDALEIASIRSENIVKLYIHELNKRSKFQYNMSETIQENKAITSLKRAKEFMFEIKKLLKEFS